MAAYLNVGAFMKTSHEEVLCIYLKKSDYCSYSGCTDGLELNKKQVILDLFRKRNHRVILDVEFGTVHYRE